MWTYRYLAAAVAERAALVPREVIGPEAQTDPRGFVAACRRAEARLAEIEDAL